METYLLLRMKYPEGQLIRVGGVVVPDMGHGNRRAWWLVRHLYPGLFAVVFLTCAFFPIDRFFRFIFFPQAGLCSISHI